MKSKFEHIFEINRNGIPYSDRGHCGELAFETSDSHLHISGDKSGLLALASKLIEVANCDISGYHKHLDDIELPDVKITPNSAEIVISRNI